MEVFVSPTTDPWINMGLESFFLNEYAGAGCLVYRDDPCLVIGKNQNAYREVNVGFCKETSIPVIRRISGGGTVYHDLGNINTAFFGERRGISDSLYERWTEPPIEFLSSLGLVIERDGRNGLELAGKKISGSAQALKRTRFLHHATLLCSSDLEILEQSIATRGEGVSGGGISSYRSPVTNVNTHLKEPMGVESIQRQWVEFLLYRSKQKTVAEIPYESEAVVQDLIANTLKTWDWDMGRTPQFDFRLDTTEGSIVFTIVKGIIEGVDSGIVLEARSQQIQSLMGQRFQHETLLGTGIGSICPNLNSLLF